MNDSMQTKYETCDWCGGDGESMQPGHKCLQCHGLGKVPKGRNKPKEVKE